MTNGTKEYFIFKKSPDVIYMIKNLDVNREARIATEIIAAYIKLTADDEVEDESQDYWAYCADDPGLSPMITWFQIKRNEYYSIELNEESCEIWEKEIMPIFQLKKPAIVACELAEEIDIYLQGAVKVIENYGNHSVIKFIGPDLTDRLTTAFDEYLDDLSTDLPNLYPKLYKLKTLNQAKLKKR